MKIINQTYEITFYRADVLDEAVALIEWYRNTTTVKLPEETVFDSSERKICEIQKPINMELFRNGA